MTGFIKQETLSTIKGYPIKGFKDRKISTTVVEFFGVHVSYNDDGEIGAHYYPYDGGKAYKVRTLPKDFTWVGKSEGLFGKELFGGGGKRIIITEGEIDALSVAQASQDKYGKIYPVVAMSSAYIHKSLLAERDWLRSFKEVVLCLDEDEAGREATAAAIKIIGIDRVKIAKLPDKDPNEVLLKRGSDELLRAIWDASIYIPNGIIEKDALWQALVEYNNTPSVLYPDCLTGFNEKSKGARLGEIALFVSGTSCGKFCPVW